MDKILRSWVLFKSSLSVIVRNKQLLVFPIIACLCTIFIFGFFLLPPVLRPTGYSYLSGEHWQAISHSLYSKTAAGVGQTSHFVMTRGFTVYMSFLYLLSMFIATFCNVAFYHEILAALDGQPVFIGRGLRFAVTKLRSILLWTLFAGVIGLIIKLIEERLPLVGRIVAKLIGIAWSVASVFAIPVMVCEEKNTNPVAMLRKSAEILIKTWGESLAGYVGLNLINTILVLGSLLWLVGAAVVSDMLGNFWIMVPAGIAWLIAIFAWSYLTGVASHVYRGALYLYAANGVVAEPFKQEMFELAWKHRKSKGAF